MNGHNGYQPTFAHASGVARSTHEGDRNHSVRMPVSQGKWSRRLVCMTMVTLSGLSSEGLIAANAAPQVSPAEAHPAFSVTSSDRRAAWQQKLTLGAGDVLTFSLYGEERDLTRRDVPIAPDGRVSYLEAQNVMAAGLTVDELRDALNAELGKFRRAPQAYVVPVAYRSKKYHILGKITRGGAFPLDRPTTLMEAVIQARGIETGLADLSRSFLVRGGRKLPVDFEKLFLNGDLSQNVVLEPDDYICFPGFLQSEVYVLGAVRQAGPLAYLGNTGALSAIAARGGFSGRAWRQQILVIRGSFSSPETFVVAAPEVLSARMPDLELRPKDIVFVSERPWVRAEELLDAAAAAFANSTVVIGTDSNVRSGK
jgi:protein involved in polysaccharide export with SLBB domain